MSPGISVSKICIPFSGGGGTDWDAFWASLISATVENAAPTHVVLTFPAATTVIVTDFTIPGFTFTSLSWTGSVLTVVLSEAVLIFDGDLTITFITTGGTATVTNNVADDGHTTVYYDSQDASTITKDGSDLVSEWDDKLAGIKNLAQVQVGNKPTIQSTGMLFNGTGAFMATAALFTGANARSVYVVYRNLATGSFNTPICGQNAGTTASTWFVVQERTLGVVGGPYLACYADDLGSALTVPDTDWKTALADYNGTTARLFKNNLLVESDAKTLNTVNDLFQVGQDQPGTFGHCEVFAIIVRDQADSDVVKAAIHNSLSRNLFFLTVDSVKIDWLDTLVEEDVTNSKRVITEIGIYNGLQYTSPGGVFNSLYLRDAYYTAYAGYIGNAEILNIYNWVKSKIPTIGVNAYWVSDFMVADGTVVYLSDYAGRGSRASIDHNAFMALMAVLYYDNTGNASFIRGELAFLEALITNVPYSGDLPYADDAAPFVGWGFEDQIKITGKLAMTSVIFYDACKKLDDICTALSEGGYSFGTIAADIKTAWATAFWNNTKVAAGTIKCVGQFDVNAAAYAIESGLVTGATATAITNALIAQLTDLIHKGYIKHVPLAFDNVAGVSMWEAVYVDAGYGNYQSGAYWTTGLPYLIDAISKVNKTLARIVMVNGVNQYANFPDMPECITSADAEVNTGYCVTGASIKVAINKLLS